MRIADLAEFNAVREAGLAKLTPDRPRVAVGMGTCGTGNGAEGVFSAFKSAIDGRGLDVQLAPVGCFGFCAQGPIVVVYPGEVFYTQVTPEDAKAIVEQHVIDGQLPQFFEPSPCEER